MPKDKLGNKLQKGDFVCVTEPGAPRIHGVIEQVELGGTLVPVNVGNKVGAGMMPGAIIVVYTMRYEYDPSGDPHLDSFLKLVGIPTDKSKLV